MTFRNWIEAGLLVLSILVGVIVNLRTYRRLKDIDGSIGIVRKTEHKGHVKAILHDESISASVPNSEIKTN